MPLWSWHQCCCRGAAGEDDCNTTKDHHRTHPEAGIHCSPNADNASNACVQQQDDENNAGVNNILLNQFAAADQPNAMDRSKNEKLFSSPHQYQMLTVIGDGSYGGVKIWLTKHVPSNQYVAVKRIDLDQCKLPLSLIQHEIIMHRLLQHRNVLSILSCFENRNELWMVLPLKAYGSCRDLLRAHFKFGLPEMAISYILKDVLQALEYLHSRGIIHRDIKASHIFIQSDGSICLSGLRHCFSMVSRGHRLRYVHDFPDFYVNSLNWASRELLEQNLSGYDTKSDIYSLGITACELANGMVPFQDMALTQMLLSKIEGTTPRLLDITTIPELADIKDGENDVNVALHESLLPYRRTFSQHFHQFIELCLVLEPQSRPTATALSTHSFFRQIQRKSNPPPLSELLKPLNPITASTIPVFVDNTVASLASDIADMALDINWIF